MDCLGVDLLQEGNGQISRLQLLVSDLVYLFFGCLLHFIPGFERNLSDQQREVHQATTPLAVEGGGLMSIADRSLLSPESRD